jgi:hypothetical protein
MSGSHREPAYSQDVFTVWRQQATYRPFWPVSWRASSANQFAAMVASYTVFKHIIEGLCIP